MGKESAVGNARCARMVCKLPCHFVLWPQSTSLLLRRPDHRRRPGRPGAGHRETSVAAPVDLTSYSHGATQKRTRRAHRWYPRPPSSPQLRWGQIFTPFASGIVKGTASAVQLACAELYLARSKRCRTSPKMAEPAQLEAKPSHVPRSLSRGERYRGPPHSREANM